MLAPSLYMLQVYDRVLASGNRTTLLMLTLLMVGAFLAIGALELVRSFVLIRIGARLDQRLSERVYTAAFEQNLKRVGGNAGQALSDLTNLRQFLSGSGPLAFFDAPWFPIYLLVIFLRLITTLKQINLSNNVSVYLSIPNLLMAKLNVLLK